ncbi:extracellular solute-binding protein [Paenibacillus sp. N1-5-1-14]|uniref:extracellular solute-binding protein n=1 Tax=Paenibacillus radicibacter TaxID=2972488 RepID=UPI002158EFD2|nr:extracellular solute-binding protein [Paenibacillus radicibacter]MCR8644065.1 extracellular solute-binding protein [Paenibacillus radicibacter]
MKKTVVSMTALLLVLSSALAACGKEETKDAATTPGATQTAKPEEAGKPFTINLRHILIKDTDKPALTRLEEVKKKTEAAVPGLTVNFEGMEENVNRFQKLRAEMSAGNPPQIFNLFGGTDTRDFSKTGNLLDLTPILTELGIKDKYNSLSEFTVDGKIYGLPLTGYAEGIFYNKKLFADNGIKVPQTYEELLAASETLKSKGIIPFALGSKEPWAINMMMNTMWVREAGNNITEDIVAGTKKWTDAGVVKAFANYSELHKKGYFPKGTLSLAYPEGQNDFRTGKAAMAFDGSWAGGSFTDETKTAVSKEVGFFAFPSTGGPGDGALNASYSNGYGFSAKLNDQEKKAVKEFIKQMWSQDQQEKQYKEEGWLPAMKFELASAKEITKDISGVMGKAKTVFPAFDSVVHAKVRDALEKGMQELIGGKITPEKLAEKIQKVQDEVAKEKK